MQGFDLCFAAIIQVWENRRPDCNDEQLVQGQVKDQPGIGQLCHHEPRISSSEFLIASASCDHSRRRANQLAAMIKTVTCQE